ncbi:MAG: DUF4919 domain-containing protein [Muribaculaceae bacterium]|nr:DUF4919 domain-containing protein [Muribaculaceae bacterium]
MNLRLILLSILATLILAVSPCAFGADKRSALGKPDLEKIARESTDPDSPLNYGRLLQEFLRNDTTMTPEEFQAFYYGTLFQEDYDPYRPAVNPRLLEELKPIYAKTKRTRADRQKMLDYAMQVIEDNPVDLRQLTNRIYVYEQNGKYDLARIWQYKLNHLLLVIAASGTGADKENAWTVVYPQHEYDFLNLSGTTVTDSHFDPAGYDVIVAGKKGASGTEHFFDIRELLHQYFLKHPKEAGK